MICSSALFADTHLYRLSWDSNPAHEAIIGFSPKNLSISPYVIYGTSTNEDVWQRADVTSNASFFSLSSSFVRLTSLPADSDIFFRVCDQDGCGQHMWFKTAANFKKPFTAIAGGDTRTGWTTRKDGNRLVAKIRPLFIMHGGDFTNGNTPFEMVGFLDDWQLTMSEDNIDGVAYKRIYPLIPTHGNHEDTNYATLCQVFGVDFVQDGICDEQDAYGAMTINGMARIYTLNSQFQESGWQVFANQMNEWLENDLGNHANESIWRIAQYHKPIFPHFDGKPKNVGLFNWWASLFYENNMNLVVESDTHINKLTFPLRPANNEPVYNREDDGGTVFVGEGSWGAPARSANQSFPWTIDLASIQQFKVLSVTADRIDLRTAEFDSTATTLSREERRDNPLALPKDIKYWFANGIGDVFSLARSAQEKTQLFSPANNDTRDFTLTSAHDSFISSANPTMNYNAYQSGMMVVNNDRAYGDTRALLKFDASSVARCATLESAVLSFQSNPAETAPISGLISEIIALPGNPTELDVTLVKPDFSENRVNWNNGNSLFSDTSLATVEVIDAGNNITIAFKDDAVKALQAQFSEHAAFGFGISALHPAIKRFIDASENNKAPVLHTKFKASKSCFNTPNNLLAVPQTLNNLSGESGDFDAYTIAPTDADRTLDIRMFSKVGDSDLYVAVGKDVSTKAFTCRPYKFKRDEFCRVKVPANEAVNIGLYGNTRYSGVQLSTSQR